MSLFPYTVTFTPSGKTCHGKHAHEEQALHWVVMVKQLTPNNATFTLAHFYRAFSATQKIRQCKWTLFGAFSAQRRKFVPKSLRASFPTR